MKDLFSLAGKTALMTGGSVGIGAMIAEGFVNFGARAIFLASRAGNFNLGSNLVVDGGESVRGVQRAFYADIRPDWVLAGR